MTTNLGAFCIENDHNRLCRAHPEAHESFILLLVNFGDANEGVENFYRQLQKEC